MEDKLKMVRKLVNLAKKHKVVKVKAGDIEIELSNLAFIEDYRDTLGNKVEGKVTSQSSIEDDPDLYHSSY